MHLLDSHSFVLDFTRLSAKKKIEGVARNNCIFWDLEGRPSIEVGDKLEQLIY